MLLMVQKDKSILGCFKSSRVREGIVPLFCKAPSCSTTFSSRPPAQVHGAAEACPEKATRILRGLEHLSHGDRLRELLQLSLEKAPERSDSSLLVPKGASSKAEDKLCQGV